MSFVILYYFAIANLIAAEVPIHFAANNGTTTYTYIAEVKTGLDEQVPNFSSFKILSSLHIQEDCINLNLEKAYLLRLWNVTHELYDGFDVTQKKIQEQSINELSTMIENPFMAFYNHNNLLIGLKFQNTESEWSKNLKKAIAVTLQVNISRFNLTDNFHQNAFSVIEPTLHGNCQITYDVHTEDYKPAFESNALFVTKTYEPQKCNRFIQKTFSHSESFRCYIEREEDLITTTKKEFYFQKNGSSLFFKKLISQELFYYFPWMFKSEIHYVQISQTILFEKNLKEKVIFQKQDFQSIPMINDITYTNPTSNFNINPSGNITNGASTMNNQSKLILKINALILKLSDYIEKNHLDWNKIDFKSNHIINNLLTSMAILKLDSIETMYNSIQDGNSMKNETIRKIFLEIIPHIGTMDSCLFIRNIVTRGKYKVPENVAITMLVKLPSYVKHPTQKLLTEMEELLQMKNIPETSIINSVLVKQAAILCFSSLIFETFKNVNEPQNLPILEMYLQHINSYLIDVEASYEMKLVHIMALRNIRIGEIQRFLVPIITKKIIIHEKQENMQIAASFAVAQSISNDKQLVHNLFWPILSNSMNLLQLRMIAYDMLMSQLPDVERAMNVHWFMVNEKNKHLYHYHYTTIKSLAHLKDPCLRPVMELAKKIWRLTKKRNDEGYLSGSYVIEYIDPKYGYGDSIKIALNTDDESGFPKMGIFEYYYSIGRKSSPVWGFYWNTNILNSALNLLKHAVINKKLVISNKVVEKFLTKTKGYESLLSQKGYFEVCIIYHERIVQAIALDSKNLNKETLLIMVKIFLQHYSEIKNKSFKINWQDLSYRYFYETSVSTDIGIPVTFYNRLPVLLSTRIDIEYSLTERDFIVKIISDNRALMHWSYEMIAYNPITTLSHSIEKVTLVDIVYPQKMEISYDFEKQNVKICLFKLPSVRDKGIRIQANNLVTIFDDENNILKNHSPLSLHYNPVNQDSAYIPDYHYTFDLKYLGLKYSQAIFSCGNYKNTAKADQWLTVFKPEDSESGYDPILKFFVSVSHKIFNEIMTLNAGSCGSFIFINESSDESKVEFNLNWYFEMRQVKSNSMFAWPNEKLHFYYAINVSSTFNESLVHSWSLNITSSADRNIEFYFIRKKPGQSNLVGCMQPDKSKLLTNLNSGKNFIFNVSVSESEMCNTGLFLINGTLSSKVLGEYKQLKHEIKQKCSKEHNSSSITKLLQDSINLPKNCLYEAIENQSFTKYEINILFREVPEEILILVRFLDHTLRAVHSSDILYLKNYTEAGKVMINLTEAPNDKGMNIAVATPFIAYEIFNLPIKYFNIKRYLDKYYESSSNICNIFTETLQYKSDSFSTISSNWTLISGDYIHFSYAVLAKVLENNYIAMRLYHGSYLLEISPTDSALQVIFDGVLVNTSNQTILPSATNSFDNYLISIKTKGTRVELQLIHVPVNIHYTKSSVTIMMKDYLQSNTDGLCKYLKFK